MDDTGLSGHRTFLQKTEEYQCMGRGNFVHKRNRQEMCVWLGVMKTTGDCGVLFVQVFTKMDLIFYTR